MRVGEKRAGSKGTASASGDADYLYGNRPRVQCPFFTRSKDKMFAEMRPREAVNGGMPGPFKWTHSLRVYCNGCATNL